MTNLKYKEDKNKRGDTLGWLTQGFKLAKIPMSTLCVTFNIYHSLKNDCTFNV